MMTTRAIVVLFVGALAVVMAACGGGSGFGVPATAGRGSPASTVMASDATGSALGATAGAAEHASTATDSASSNGHSCAPPYPVGVPTTSTVFCADPSRMESARVVRIVDGDTFHVRLNGKDETVRFYGINATEVGQPCSAEATARTRELVGNEVRLLPDARERDRYGRLLRYVYTPAGLSVDAEMVAEGLAHAWRTDGALRVPMIALEDAAHAGGVGCLWH